MERKTNRFKRLLNNIIHLVNALLKIDKIHWHSNVYQVIDSEVDSKTTLHKPYKLTNVKIGLGTYVSHNSIISQTSIGKFCSIGPNFLCGWGIHPLDGISTSPSFYSTKNRNGLNYSTSDKIQERKAITIENDVFIGANVTVLDGIRIGNGAVIGAGAVVSKDIPPYAIAVGCPIKIIKYRFPDKTIEKLLETQWWDRDEEYFKIIEENFFDIDSFLEISNSTKS